MKKERILIPILGIAVTLSGMAYAQSPHRSPTSSASPRIDVGKRLESRSTTSRVTRLNARSSATRAARPGITNRGSASSRRPLSRDNAGTLGNRRPLGNPNLFGGRDFGDNPLGSLLGEYLFREYGRGHRYDPFEAEKERADAYRDAAIANAVVNVVGILATANQPRQPVACPPPGPSGPRGHVEQRRVLVQEARVEEYRVWVPEHTIPDTGETVEGHYETRRREIPAVYEERSVWVPDGR